MNDVQGWVRAVSCATWLLCGCGAEVLDVGECEGCGVDEPAASLCTEAGAARTPREPAAGEVRITEWMANPKGADSDSEWVELLFESDADLHGLQLGSSLEELRAVEVGEACVPVGAGSRIVFGASPAAAPRVDAELPLSLANTGGRSIVVAAGDTLLEAIEGVAWQVDSAGAVCEAHAEDVYAADNRGTPGEPNSRCIATLGVGECFDGDTPRAIVPPATGEAIISEWMANPDGVDNRSGEWVEVRFEAPADANGLTLSDLAGGESVLVDESCVEVPAGGHVVFARKADPSENGGVEGVAAALSLSLNNRDEEITLRVGDEALDAVAYGAADRGVATQVDPDGRVCAAVDVYGDGDLGTPGTANPSCS